MTVTEPGRTKRLSVVPGDVHPKAVQSSPGLYLARSLHLPGMGRNITTSVKLLNAALQRVMDPGVPKRRAAHKAPKLWS